MLSIWVLPLLALVASIVGVFGKTRSKSGETKKDSLNKYGFATIFVSVLIAAAAILFNFQAATASAERSRVIEDIRKNSELTNASLDRAQKSAEELKLQLNQATAEVKELNEKLDRANNELTQARIALGNVTRILELSGNTVNGLSGQSVLLSDILGSGVLSFSLRGCGASLTVERTSPAYGVPIGILLDRGNGRKRISEAKRVTLLFDPQPPGKDCQIVYRFAPQG